MSETKDMPPERRGGLIDTLADWLMSQALGETDMESLIDGCCNRLAAAGIPLTRAYLAFRTLHPLFAGFGYTWQQGQGVTMESYSFDESDGEFESSPVHHMETTGIPYLRRRLTGAEALLDFPVLKDLKDMGVSDYMAYLVPFSGDDGVTGSWATNRATGFHDRDIHALQRIQRRLAVASKVIIREQKTRNILNAYFGVNAADRILSGHIRRGDVERINAVIWYSDLRGSTPLADRMKAEAYLDVLNDYFESTAGAVIAHDGEVLMLIGDAVLAIFPIHFGRSQRQACAAAIEAAKDAQRRLVDCNKRRAENGEEQLAFGLALHVGEVVYGNIGLPERLELTVVGAATNEASRLQGLTKALGRPVLVSEGFAQNLNLDWEPMGRHELRGVAAPQAVFAPPE